MEPCGPGCRCSCHAAAPALFAALEECKAVLDALPGGPGSMTGGQVRAHQIADAALAKARGEG
jgi:hypothetical protein